MLICYLCIFGEFSVQIFCPFPKQVVCFLMLSFKNSLQNLDNSLLPDTPFANIFSLFVFFLNKIIAHNLVLSLDLGARWLDGTISGC